MTATLGTGDLDQFCADMQALVDTQPDNATVFDRGAVYLERLVRNPNALPEQYQRPSGKGKRPNHGSYAIYRGPGLLVSAVVWGPGDRIGPHDHRTWGMIGVMSNAVLETRYRRVDDGEKEGFAILERDRATLVKPGEVSLLLPDVDEIHAMDNDSDRPTVEIHVYGTDLVGLPRSRFDIESNRIIPFISEKFDNC